MQLGKGGVETAEVDEDEGVEETVGDDGGNGIQLRFGSEERSGVSLQMSVMGSRSRELRTLSSGFLFPVLSSLFPHTHIPTPTTKLGNSFYFEDWIDRKEA